MIFIKSNSRLEENATFSRALDRLMDKIFKGNSDEIKIVLDEKIPTTKQFNQFKTGKTGNHKFNSLRDYLIYKDSAGELQVFDKMKNNNFREDGINKFIQFYDKFKTYQSFKGKVDFSHYFDLLDFEQHIYYDKLHKYKETFSHNKRIIPDFISSIFASMIQENIVSYEIRRVLEQYVIALMINKDYKNYATYDQLGADFHHLVSKIKQQRKNYVYIWSGSPVIFDAEEKKS